MLSPGLTATTGTNNSGAIRHCRFAQSRIAAIVASMVRVLDFLLALACAGLTAFVLGTIFADEGVPLDFIRLDALSSAGIIVAAVAGGSLLKRK